MPTTKTKNSEPFDWMEEYPAAVTVCDRNGLIVAMNRRSREQFDKRGGAALIGSSLFDCHPEKANAIIRRQLESREANCYRVQGKSGQRLVLQVPWYRDGVFAGLVETSTPIQGEIPLKKR